MANMSSSARSLMGLTLSEPFKLWGITLGPHRNKLKSMPVGFSKGLRKGAKRNAPVSV
jgi:hypothetical protein